MLNCNWGAQQVFSPQIFWAMAEIDLIQHRDPHIDGNVLIEVVLTGWNASFGKDHGQKFESMTFHCQAISSSFIYQEVALAMFLFLKAFQRPLWVDDCSLQKPIPSFLLSRCAYFACLSLPELSKSGVRGLCIQSLILFPRSDLQTSSDLEAYTSSSIWKPPQSVYFFR